MSRYMKNIQFKTGQDVELQFQGKITINAQIIRALFAEMRPPIPAPPASIAPPAPPAPSPERPPVGPHVSGTDKRLAYTMRETAEILGVSYITVHRLIQRGLLRSSRVLRHKLIPKFEIERFLKATI
jgi:excisionase family DNA binding protein